MPRNPEAQQSMQRIAQLWRESDAIAAREHAERERILAHFRELPLKARLFISKAIIQLLNSGRISPFSKSRQ